MNLTKILSIGLFLVSIVLAGYLYVNINETIKFRESIAATEKQIIDKLAVIREAQVPITVRSEKITQLSYGQEEVEVIIDTIGYMPAKDKIFKKRFAMNATTDGTFMGFIAKPGDFVVKGTPAYRLRPEGADKAQVYPFTESGTVSSLASLTSGTKLLKGQNVAGLWEYTLNPNVNIKNLSLVPGSKGVQFEIFVAKVERNQMKVSVIEVKDPKPINPERRANNEAKNRQPLGFGSRVDVITSGNWE